MMQSCEPPYLMAATSTDEVDIAAAIRCAIATGPRLSRDPNAAPDWLLGRASAAAVDLGR